MTILARFPNQQKLISLSSQGEQIVCRVGEANGSDGTSFRWRILIPSKDRVPVREKKKEVNWRAVRRPRPLFKIGENFLKRFSYQFWSLVAFR